MNFDIHEICALAKEAGAAIMAVYDSPFAVEMKEDKSPLTAADRASHEVIEAGLLALHPEIPVLSEEGKGIPYEERAEWRRFWLVDPLDGTKEFIKRNGEFTVNIALIEEGVPVAGVVYLPARERLYWGVSGEGAWLEESGSEAVRIHTRRLPAGAGLTVVQSRSHPSPELDDYLKGINVAASVSVGSSLKFCVVAEGKADLYPRLGPTMEWDTAAGQAVVECAGGKVIDLANRRLTYNKQSLLNGYFVVSA